MHAFDELDDQELVNLIGDLRPAVKQAALGRDLDPMVLDVTALRAAEDEIRARGWVEHDGFWQRIDDYDYVLSHRPS